MGAIVMANIVHFHRPEVSGRIPNTVRLRTTKSGWITSNQAHLNILRGGGANDVMFIAVGYGQIEILFAIHFKPILLRKAWIHIFCLHLWINNGAN